jgi:hypothetical protein
MASAWGASWGSAWGVSWGAATPSGAPSGGAGGGRRRQFPFRNRYDDPELFRERKPAPEPVEAHPVQAEGDPVEATRPLVGPAGLADVGLLRRAPPTMPALPPVKLEKRQQRRTPRFDEPEPNLGPPPLTEDEQREEEEAALHALGLI